MKKMLILILVFLMALTSLWAAKEYTIVAGSTCIDSRTGVIPSFGIFSQYQFGFSVNDRVSLGFGTYIHAGFPFNMIRDTGYNASVSVALGPAFSLKVSQSGSLACVIGPEATAYSAKNSDNEKAGFGVGYALSYTFIPAPEQKERTQMGLTCGISGSMTFFEGESTPSYSGRMFVGLTILQPFVGVYYPDIYEAVLDSVYSRL